MSPIDSARIAERRQRLQAIDQDIIGLIRQHQEVVLQLRTLRRLAGLREFQLAQENEVLSQYHEALGGTGTAIALRLLSPTPPGAAGERVAPNAA
ncbi:chorismate mutase [Streptomyces desertarenae]|uniref:Chorismate mutase n=1 Tax=Streptomyces desertarenae TaxID=2666184 RepID=A0ABW4PRT2_9ACTN